MLEASKRTQDWFTENLQEVWDKEIWPPSSSDCLNTEQVSGAIVVACGGRGNYSAHWVTM